MTVKFKIDNLSNMSAEIGGFAEFLRGNAICDDDIFASRLVSCELITNVIRHSGETAVFTGELLNDRIAITVTAKRVDGVDLHPSLPDVFAESGRGLFIINSVCFGDIEQTDEGLRVYIKRH